MFVTYIKDKRLIYLIWKNLGKKKNKAIGIWGRKKEFIEKKKCKSLIM